MWGVGDGKGEAGKDLFANTPPDDDIDILRALFNKFDENKDGGLEPSEFGNLLCQVMPTRVRDFQTQLDDCGGVDGVQFDLKLKLDGGADMTLHISKQFKEADTDGNGMIDFDEFVAYYRSVMSDPRFDEASDMFRFFDKDGSNELDKAEFLNLLNQIFPERCDENQRIVDAEFAAADVDGSNGISYPEFVMYYHRLRALYDALEDPDDAAARKAAEKEARLQSIAAPLVPCPGCKVDFLADVLDVHQRSCEAYELWLRSGGGAAGAGNGGAQDLDENGFVGCQWCGRRFFPDRLPVHLRSCKKKKEQDGQLCRETMVDGQTLSRGKYD